MLSFEEISKHYTEKENRLPRLVLKEYLQYRILDSIFSSKYGDRLAFMGGTAVRLVYGSDRFSEDLDLDNRDLSEADFATLVRMVMDDLEGDGVEVEIRNTFKGVYHCYMKFPGILFENRLSPLQNEKILIRLDSFRTEGTTEAHPFVLAKADIFSEIRVYPASMILVQKIDALFHRRRSKGRDIYDIVYLYSRTKPDIGYLRERIGVSNELELIGRMKSLFTDSELKSLAEDVRPFLLNRDKTVQVEKFRLWLEGMESDSII